MLNQNVIAEWVEQSSERERGRIVEAIAARRDQLDCIKWGENVDTYQRLAIAAFLAFADEMDVAASALYEMFVDAADAAVRAVVPVGVELMLRDAGERCDELGFWRSQWKRRTPAPSPALMVFSAAAI
ncbi:MAG: hypothetical protein H7Y88_11305 [Phycisphaerales bacterium]|nr:hypothetical protein [Phycisphaerales bacterium]